jgi:cyanate permease
VIEQGLSEVVLGILNGVGSVVGIIGTLVYPILVKRTGLVRTGVIGFWSEFSMLILCFLSLFVHGTSFTPFKNFTIGSCHLYETMNNNSRVTWGKCVIKINHTL